MSSKLYKKYISLKIEDNNCFYLFKSGFFYIFISNDAWYLSPILGLKLTNLTRGVVKCGFPKNAYKKYCEKFKELNLNVKVITLDNKPSNMTTLDNHYYMQEIFEIIERFLKVNVNDLSISEAFDKLIELQNDFKQLAKKDYFKDNEEKNEEKGKFI